MNSLLPLLALTPLALASYDANINYGSPSLLHRSLGISVPKVMKRQSAPAYANPANLSFTHGIASGDPYADSVILWTRASPTSNNDASNKTVSGNVPLYNHETEEYVAASANPICVSYVVAKDQGLRHVVDQGRAYTSSDIDYTIKVESKHLRPFTEYYYQFRVCDSDVVSPLGRTKTAPRANDDVPSLGLAVYSCSNFPNGFFNAYGNSARKDNVDFVIHVSLCSDRVLLPALLLNFYALARRLHLRICHFYYSASSRSQARDLYALRLPQASCYLPY